MTAGAARVVLLCGGASEEHEVSLASARSVLAAAGERLALEPLVLDRSGRPLDEPSGRRLLGLPARAGRSAAVAPGGSLPDPLAGRAADDPPRTGLAAAGMEPTETAAGRGLAGALRPGDVVFPLLHGPFGEDGRVQGLLELIGVPFVGSGVLASAVGMDKLTMKAVFAAHGLPQVRYAPIVASAFRRDPDAAVAALGAMAWPRFVKPANLGSSIGIARADDPVALRAAIESALSFDRRVIVEEAVVGARELEVGVLGNEDPEVSPVGEIRYDAPFYDYETKYTDGRAALDIPARVPDGVAERARDLARRAFAALDAAGLARVDLFYDARDDALYLNEINTMPGFTATSMYPKLWEAAGVPYEALVERLVALALERRG